MKRIIAALAAVSLSVSAFAGIVSHKQVSNNTAIFELDNGQKMALRFCSPDVIRVEYSFSGKFLEAEPTPAVVNAILKDISISVEESESVLEIFTDALRVSIDREPLRMRVYDKYQKLIVSDVVNPYSNAEGEISCTKMLAKDEQIFGLGEKSGLMNRRGEVFTMWNSDRPCYCIDEDPLYKSIPFFISSKRYGVFFDNSWKSTFDFGSTKRDRYVFSSKGGEMIYYIITGNDYKDILGKYIQLTGKPVMPPKWALGFSQCRGLYTREDQALDVAARFRELQIPCDVIYQDIGWTQYLQNFEWREGNYKHPVEMLSKLHEQGFKVVVSQDPVISRNNRTQWEEADSLGLFVWDRRTGRTYDMPWPWGGNCGVVDFTNPAAADWWGAYQQKAVNDGINGFWTDMGEPAWSNEEDDDRLNMQHVAGPHAKIHNVYGLYWDRVVTEQLYKHNPDRRVFQMTRSAFSGMQRYCFSWTGDSGNSQKMSDSWEQFAYQIPMMLSAGLGGIPFITGDITGYCGTIDDYEQASELYVRWMQFGLFTPLSRSHHEGDTAVEPWMFTPEAMMCARKAIELKYTLLPYIYTCAREAYDTGIPLMRAMFLEFPQDKECMRVDTQFMFGPDLLVAPVVEEGARSRELYLPKGKWYDWYTHTLYNGGRYIEVDAPLDRTPLFVKANSIIPTLPVQQYTDENPDAMITFNVFPMEGKTASCSVYEDDGVTLGYQRGEYSFLSTSCHLSEGSLSVDIPDLDRDIRFKVYCEKKPSKFLINGNKSRGSWNKAECCFTFFAPKTKAK